MSTLARWRAHATWEGSHPSVPGAREFVRRQLSTHGLSPMADDVSLIVRELATNVITHGRGMALVEALCWDWGVSPGVAGGKQVWARFACEGHGTRF